MNTLLDLVADLNRLERAFRDVRSGARRNSWPQLRAELAEVEAAPLTALQRIRAQLVSGTYRFSPKWGYAKRKSGGSRRGVTVGGVSDRIVQRAILNLFYSTEPEVTRLLGDLPQRIRMPHSFAGVPGRGVPEAVLSAQAVIRRGAKAFAYSDMKDFFPCVPRREVISIISVQIDDPPFVALFTAALETELANLDEIEPWRELFPLAETGVAQGSLLSTLAGNLSLGCFDERLNADGLTTIRYLDDFLILGPDLDAVREGFAGAQRELARWNMVCYEPGDGSRKAELGMTADGFNFLGCRIHADGIAPSRSSGRRLLAEIDRLMSRLKRRLEKSHREGRRRRTEDAYVQTLAAIDRQVRGWGDAYAFATNRLPFSQIDAQIDRRLQRFDKWFRRNYNRFEPRHRRRLQGIALLADTPPATTAVENAATKPKA